MSEVGSFHGNDFQPNINQQPARGDFLQLGRFWHTAWIKIFVEHALRVAWIQFRTLA